MMADRWRIALLVLVTLAVHSSAQETDTTSAFTFELEAGRFGSAFSALSANAQGECDVVFRGRKGVTKGQVRLTGKDLREFDRLVAEARLFKEPIKPPQPRLHEIVGRLRVQRGAEWREFRIAGHGHTGTLVGWLLRIANEAELLLKLGQREGLHRVNAAVDPRLVGKRVLHPEAFREPLSRLVSDSDSVTELRVIVAALSCVTSPEEWSKLMQGRLTANADRRDKLVGVLANHPFPSNAQSSHYEALMDLLLQTLRTQYRDSPNLPKSPRMAASAIIRQLGHERYRPAIPDFESMIDRFSTLERPWRMSALASMGNAAIDPLSRLLDSPKPAVRLAAAGTVERVLTKNPRYPTSKGERISAEEQATILKRLREEIAPKLRDLAATDAEPRVRKQASEALERVEQGWRR